MELRDVSRSTLVVLAVAVAGVVAALLTVRAERRPAASGETSGGVLARAQELPVDGVTRVTLERRGSGTLVFERRGESWVQREPFEHPMDPFSIRQFAAGALSATVVSRLETAAPGAGAGAAELGLEPPVVVLALEWPGGSATWHLGRRGVAGRWYARRAGDDAILVCQGDLYERAAEMSPSEWRDRRIFATAGPDTERIAITDGKHRTVLERERRTWRMVEPAAARVDRAALQDLLRTLSAARSGGFMVDQPADLPRFGLEPPAASVAITRARLSEEGEEVRREPEVERLLVGGPLGVSSQDRFGLIEGRPAVVRLPEALLRALFRRPEALIDPFGTWVEPPDVAGLTIRGSGWELQVRRGDGTWTPRADELLAALNTVRAERVELRQYPRELEVSVITLEDITGRPLDTIRVFRDPSTGRLGLENGDDVLRIMPESFKVALEPGELARPPGSAG